MEKDVKSLERNQKEGNLSRVSVTK